MRFPNFRASPIMVPITTAKITAGMLTIFIIALIPITIEARPKIRLRFSLKSSLR